MEKAGVTDPSKCLFVDDSRKNCDGAQALGWSAVHFREDGLEVVEGGRVKVIGNERLAGAKDNGVQVINNLEELRTLWPQVFKSTPN
jgi:pyrimidine and pyridine-specific 5'-nucleotidase